jgi:hypothetical protein
VPDPILLSRPCGEGRQPRKNLHQEPTSRPLPDTIASKRPRVPTTEHRRPWPLHEGIRGNAVSCLKGKSHEEPFDE